MASFSGLPLKEEMVPEFQRLELGSIASIYTIYAAVGQDWGSNGRSTVPIWAAPAWSERFKGVLLQPDWLWGAHIYVHPIWISLGAFPTERAAAVAYDSAATLLLGDSHYRNFPTTELTDHERRFQTTLSAEVVIGMIRDGSYASRFSEFLQVVMSPTAVATGPPGGTGGSVVLRELFQKQLTASDVGKYCRLLIPKRFAVQYLPTVSSEGVMVNFRDRENQTWVFRYTCWQSRQSHVFTTGWSAFVKEKNLRAKDAIVFYHCHEGYSGRAFFVIDVLRSEGGGAAGAAGLGSSADIVEVMDEEERVGVVPEVVPESSSMAEERQGLKKELIKLFGHVWMQTIPKTKHLIIVQS